MSWQLSWLRGLTSRNRPLEVKVTVDKSGVPVYTIEDGPSAADTGAITRAIRRDQRDRAMGADRGGSNRNGRVVFDDVVPLFTDPLADESIPGPVRVAMHKVRCAEIRLGDANRRAAKSQRELVKANKHLTKVRDQHSGDTASVTADSTSGDAPRHHELLNDLIDAQNVMLAAEAAEFTAEVSYRDAQADTAAAADALDQARRRTTGGRRR